MESAARDFFGQSLEEKRKVRRNEVKVVGYYEREHTKNVRDWMEAFDFSVEDSASVAASSLPDDHGITFCNNQWPQFPPKFREVCEAYSKDMVKLALKLMELIALSLRFPSKRFHEYLKHQTSSIRLNYYPPCPFPDLALGVGRHRDGEVLTILAQDQVEGLQVLRISDGQWVGVKPIPHAYIIILVMYYK